MTTVVGMSMEKISNHFQGKAKSIHNNGFGASFPTFKWYVVSMHGKRKGEEWKSKRLMDGNWIKKKKNYKRRASWN
jgi:hypothetical protein